MSSNLGLSGPCSHVRKSLNNKRTCEEIWDPRYEWGHLRSSGPINTPKAALGPSYVKTYLESSCPSKVVLVDSVWYQGRPSQPALPKLTAYKTVRNEMAVILNNYIFLLVCFSEIDNGDRNWYLKLRCLKKKKKKSLKHAALVWDQVMGRGWKSGK